MSKPSEMTHRAFSVIKRGEGQEDYWLPIGAAFEHSDGKGFNVIHQALPIDGKLVLRVPKSDEEEQQPPHVGTTKNPANAAGSRPQNAGTLKAAEATRRLFYAPWSPEEEHITEEVKACPCEHKQS